MTLRPLVKTVFLRPLPLLILPSLVPGLQVRQVLVRFGKRGNPGTSGTHDDHLHELVDQMISGPAQQFFMDEDIEFHTELLKKINNPLAEQL